ncbi:MAG: Stp1/IreP family PP2C-type Ser/Thr phosphatase [Paenibacillaceae bacterium]|jgi:serine/threonine protein phosphatase PrpC|nr:Stp1/IreP family PP2C-type Ser/Thr phosphatase [Paenibacillaceae bacterium]
MRTAERTDVGRIRSVNEDRAVILPEKCGMVIAIVADGMGGHQAGDIASQLAIEKIREELSGLPEDATLEARKGAIRLAVEAANGEVYRQASQREQLRGMGTTVVVSLATAEQLVVGHIGDSRAYLAAGSQLVQLTEDHSLVNELLKSGQITREEAEHHPRRNVLLRALGTDNEVQVDVVEHSWAEGDILLMCSDGLSNMVDEEECLAVLQSEHSLENKVDELVERALTAGGDDNVTVVLIENRPVEASSKEG